MSHNNVKWWRMQETNQRPKFAFDSTVFSDKEFESKTDHADDRIDDDTVGAKHKYGTLLSYQEIESTDTCKDVATGDADEVGDRRLALSSILLPDEEFESNKGGITDQKSAFGGTLRS